MPEPIAALNEESLRSDLRELVRETVEDAMVEMYLVRVSTRRIEDVSEILWGSSVSAATVSNLNDKAIASVEEWRNRPLDRAHPCAYENVAVMVPSASTTTATARSSAPRRGSRSRPSAGGSSSRGSRAGGSRACACSPATRPPP